MGQIVTESLELFLKSQTELLQGHLNSGVPLDLRFVIQQALKIQEAARMMREVASLPEPAVSPALGS